MSDLAWFFVLSLAVWRISALLVIEDGPFDIFARFRRFIGVRYRENNTAYGTNVIAQLFTCVWCLSIWVGFGLAWASGYSVNIHSYFLVGLALSAMAIAWNRIVS